MSCLKLHESRIEHFPVAVHRLQSVGIRSLLFVSPLPLCLARASLMAGRGSLPSGFEMSMSYRLFKERLDHVFSTGCSLAGFLLFNLLIVQGQHGSLLFGLRYSHFVHIFWM